MTKSNPTYALCISFTEGGVFNCMWDKQEGDTWYTLLYNQDETTNETNRYTCLVSRRHFPFL
ncbi:hypothetical protein DPMN_107354 [Dreissena polymorpha]|uniref:Uncharacterized protein n=1 Tax=Dreissena polymorpha TaxID=45954 RepID=A0A9D4K6P7_DREPO|nr:hypothetical protein DPMN_107354 [Dreissena polymorpha]